MIGQTDRNEQTCQNCQDELDRKSCHSYQDELDRWIPIEATFEYECPFCRHRENWKTCARYCQMCGTRLYRPRWEDSYD